MYLCFWVLQESELPQILPVSDGWFRNSTMSTFCLIEMNMVEANTAQLPIHSDRNPKTRRLQD